METVSVLGTDSINVCADSHSKVALFFYLWDHAGLHQALSS